MQPPRTALPDPQALRAEIESLHPACFAWALACCGRSRDDACEVLQQSYEKLITGRARFEGRSSFKTWLFGVIRRTSSEHRRREWIRSLRAAWGGTQDRPSRPGPDRLMAQHEAGRALAKALGELPARQRQVLHLVFQQELSISEAASVMGVSVGAARQHYERGKKNLLDRLDEKGVGLP